MPKKEVVLITGMAGFIGFHLARKMVGAGHDVIGFDNLNDYYDVQLKKDRLAELGLPTDALKDHETVHATNGKVWFFKGDLNDQASWDLLASSFQVTAIIHLAAQAGVRYSLEKPEAYVQSNVSGFLQVLEFCKRQSLKKLIYASSSSVYGLESEQPFSETEACDKPVSLYAATKRTNELMAYTYHHLFGIESIGLRFFTVYGPWGRPDMAPYIFAKAALEQRPIKVYNHGEQARDFTFVDDIVEGLYRIYGQPEKIKGTAICNIGNGSPVPLMDFIGAIERAGNTTLEKNFLPAQPGDVVVTFANTSRLQSEFGVQVHTSIEDGVDRFFNWYRSYYQPQNSTTQTEEIGH